MGLTELIQCASNVQRKIVFVDKILPDQFTLHGLPMFERGFWGHADRMLHPVFDNSVPHLEAAKCIPMEIWQLRPLAFRLMVSWVNTNVKTELRGFNWARDGGQIVLQRIHCDVVRIH